MTRIDYAQRLEAVHQLFLANDGVIDSSEAVAEFALLNGKSGKPTKSGLNKMAELFQTSTFQSSDLRTEVRDGLLSRGVKLDALGIDISPAVLAFDQLSAADKLDTVFELVDQEYYDGFLEFGTVHNYEMIGGFKGTILDPNRHLSGPLAAKAKEAMTVANTQYEDATFAAVVKDGQTYGYTVQAINDSWHTVPVYYMFDRNMEPVGFLNPLGD